MGDKRNHFTQTSTLEERLSQFASDLERKAETAEPGSEEAFALRKRLRKIAAAQQFNTHLNDGK